MKPIQGFYVHDEDSGTDGVAKYDYEGLENAPDVVGQLEVATVNFSVENGVAHSSLNDQIKIDIPQGDYYKVTISSGVTATATVYEIDGSGTAQQKNTSASMNGTQLFKADVGIAKIGVYISAQSTAYSATVKVEKVTSLFVEMDATAKHVDGLVSECYEVETVAWTRGIMTANGSIDSGNGSCSEIIYNPNSISLADGCRAVIGFYRGNEFVGKLNATGGVDKVGGSWGYVTGFFDFSELLEAYNCNGVRVSILPTNGITIVADTAQKYGELFCTFFVPQAKIKDTFFVNWWERGAINSNGTNSPSNTRVRSDFIDIKDNNKIAIILPSGKWCSYSFYENITIGSFVSQASAWVERTTVLNIPPLANYIRIVVRNSDNSTITVDDIVFDSVGVELSKTLLKEIETEDICPQENTIIKSVNHRGYNADAPENTLPAYVLSRKKGFKYVETDVMFTSDGVAVLLHDETLNRTARNADGSELSATVNIRDITYEQALEYDFGIWKDAKFAGTKIPTFDEFILLCKQLSLHPFIELKNGNWSSDNAETIADTINKYGMGDNVSFISFMFSALQDMKEYFPKALLALAPTGGYTDATFETLITNLNTLKGDNVVLASVNKDSTTDALYEKLSNSNVNVLLWTVDNSYLLTELKPGVVAVLTDTLKVGSIVEKYALGS